MPDGTQGDPYIVYYWSDLVEKAAEEGVYITIGLDINIMSEYPDGDMPQLVCNAIIDGDNHVISNLYSTSASYSIVMNNASSQMSNLFFRNIYKTNNEFVQLKGDNSDYHFFRCKFSGITWKPLYRAPDSNGSQHNFKQCSFNIKYKGDQSAILTHTYSYLGIYNCYFKVDSESSNPLFASTKSAKITDSYIEANVPTGCYSLISNSVLDITTTASFTASGSSSNDLCIINSTHAPNASVSSTPGVTVENGFALVDNAHWLDESYLSGIGFNIGVVT